MSLRDPSVTGRQNRGNVAECVGTPAASQGVGLPGVTPINRSLLSRGLEGVLVVWSFWVPLFGGPLCGGYVSIWAPLWGGPLCGGCPFAVVRVEDVVVMFVDVVHIFGETC